MSAWKGLRHFIATLGIPVTILCVSVAIEIERFGVRLFYCRFFVLFLFLCVFNYYVCF